MSHNDPHLYLQEHIVKGDRGDGVPNALSPGDVFVSGGRQKPVRQATLNKIVEAIANDKAESEDWYEGYKRNAAIIDLSNTPSDIVAESIRQYHEQADKGRKKLFNFFISRKLNNLIENISEF